MANRDNAHDDRINEHIARQLLARTGVVFRKTMAREKMPISWLALSRIYRRMELRGEIRGGRFVAGFSGEQFALPKAVSSSATSAGKPRRARRCPSSAPTR